MLLRILLSPFSLLYGMVTFVRNKLYDRGLISSVRYGDLCVFGVGNITTGGTGKTPFTEYLIRLLSPNRHNKIAVLSRGYKRRTKGFIMAGAETTAEDIGDELFQIHRKFPDIVVAADVDRIRGIAKIRERNPEIRIIVLDDAFQYRKITPSLSILLADYHRPLYRDGMLPGGRLREWPCFARRADVPVVTKTPADIAESEKDDIARRYARYTPKRLHFAGVSYGRPIPVFPETAPAADIDFRQHDILLVTGIAAPEPLEQYLRSGAASVQTVAYPDHHDFSEKDINAVLQRFEAMPSQRKLILTTEKDAARLRTKKIPETGAAYIYYIPIEVKFIGDENRDFDRIVNEAVEKIILS